MTLGLSQPSSSGLSAVLQVFNAGDGGGDECGGSLVAELVAAGGRGWGVLRAGDGGRWHVGLLSQYMLSIDMVDTLPPPITSVSLPGEGTTSRAVVDRFTVRLSRTWLRRR